VHAIVRYPIRLVTSKCRARGCACPASKVNILPIVQRQSGKFLSYLFHIETCQGLTVPLSTVPTHRLNFAFASSISSFRSSSTISISCTPSRPTSSPLASLLSPITIRSASSGHFPACGCTQRYLYTTPLPFSAPQSSLVAPGRCSNMATYRLKREDAEMPASRRR
jgi:hypothetical protein